MASLSDLNKQERKIRRDISQLREHLREGKISKNDFEGSLKPKNDELERISGEKSRLIGASLPPIPVPPRAPPREASPGLDSIKKSILGQEADITVPPRPPAAAGPGPKKKPKAGKAPPSVKKKPRKAPAKPTARKARAAGPPAGDSALSDRIGGNFREISEMKSDIARHEGAYSKLKSEIDGIKKRSSGLDEVNSDVKALKLRIEKIDFQGLTKEIYDQFEKMNKSVKDSERKTDDLIEKMNVEIKTLKEKVGEAMQAKKQLEELDIPNMRKDMESLKQKSQYIEQHIERVDLNPIVDMIKELETKVSNLRTSSALVIE